MRTRPLIAGIVALLFSSLGIWANEVGDDGGHLKIDNPAELGAGDLVATYTRLRDTMAEGYALSQYPEAQGFTEWRLYNTAPYLSATHGNRYVNNYANSSAKDYDALGKGVTMPAGAVLAKDSFTITADGKVYPGALFLMEKLTESSSPATADWRYVMIMPDGSLYGDTTGDGAEEMTFCHDCHKARKNRDYLFYVPSEFRR